MDSPTPTLSHPSVTVSVGSDESQIDTLKLYGRNLYFKTVIKWKMDNVVGLCNLATQLQGMRRRGIRVSYLLLLDLNVPSYRASVRYLHRIMEDPRTSIILYNLKQGVPAFLLERVNHVIEAGNKISASFHVDDLPVRKLALVVAKQLGPHLAALGLKPDETVSRERIRAQYRKAVLVAHPDKGGSPEAFERITEAYDAIMGWIGSSD